MDHIRSKSALENPALNCRLAGTTTANQGSKFDTGEPAHLRLQTTLKITRNLLWGGPKPRHAQESRTNPAVRAVHESTAVRRFRPYSALFFSYTSMEPCTTPRARESESRRTKTKTDNHCRRFAPPLPDNIAAPSSHAFESSSRSHHRHRVRSSSRT